MDQDVDMDSGPPPVSANSISTLNSVWHSQPLEADYNDSISSLHSSSAHHPPTGSVAASYENSELSGEDSVGEVVGITEDNGDASGDESGGNGDGSDAEEDDEEDDEEEEEDDDEDDDDDDDEEGENDGDEDIVIDATLDLKPSLETPSTPQQTSVDLGAHNLTSGKPESNTDADANGDLPPPNRHPSVAASSPLPPLPATPPVKAKQKRAARSPSPIPLPPRPPLKTIRLQIKLCIPGSDDGYAVDVAKLAKESGMGRESPPPIVNEEVKLKAVVTDSEVDAGNTTDGRKKRKKRAPNTDYYDTHDPFIDDSELAVDERKFFAQTKQQGFYVSSGEVALVKDETPKKRGKKPTSTQVQVREGSKDRPIAVGSEEDKEEGVSSHVSSKKRKRYTEIVENGKKRKVLNEEDFHEELIPAIAELRAASQKEEWLPSTKSKFPAHIKPLLAATALKAISLDCYDADFFDLMPRIFPYNKFTLTKLIKRVVFQDHKNLINEKIENGLKELKIIADEGFEKAQEDWEKACLVWATKQKEKDGAGNGPTLAAMAVDGDEIPPSATQVAGDADGNAKEREDKPPPKRYRLTETMKTIIWQLVELSNESVRIEHEKCELEKQEKTLSEQGLRKVLYQRIVACFPEDWIDSGFLSRHVSLMKKRHEKEKEGLI